MHDDLIQACKECYVFMMANITRKQPYATLSFLPDLDKLCGFRYGYDR